MRLVPLYVLFDGEALRDHVDITPEGFYERLAAAKTLPTTSQPTPADFLATYEELAAAGYDRIWSLHLTSKLSGTFESAQRAAAQLGDDRVRVVDTETASLAVAMLAEAIERRLGDGTTDEEIEELVERFKRTNGVVFTVGDARVPAEGRPDRHGAGARGLAAQREADPHRRGRRGRPARTRARTPEGARGVREAVRRRDRGRDGPGSASRSRTRTRRSGSTCSPTWRTRCGRRPTIELVEPLGAVVGTHAGPGAVGFFWFQD